MCESKIVKREQDYVGNKTWEEKMQFINTIILTLMWNPHAVQLCMRKERANSLDFILWALLCFQIAKQLFFHVLTNKTYKERPRGKGISTEHIRLWSLDFLKPNIAYYIMLQLRRETSNLGSWDTYICLPLCGVLRRNAWWQHMPRKKKPLSNISSTY